MFVPVVLTRLEAEHRRQVVAEVDPDTFEWEPGEENFDMFVTISVLHSNDESVSRKIALDCHDGDGPLYLAYYRVYGIVGSVAEYDRPFGT